MLTQCNGVVFFSPRCGALLGNLVVPYDAPHALGVDHVAPALDERIFSRGATQIAIPHAACALEARTRLKVPAACLACRSTGQWYSKKP